MAIPTRTLSALFLLAGLWWLLSGGEPSSWVIGAPAVSIAVWSVHMLRSQRSEPLSLTGLLGFLPFFLWESLRGGVDVALRTSRPRMRIQPGFVFYPLRLRSQGARVLFVNCASLLPGTLAADLHERGVDVHVLDTGSDPLKELRRLEWAVQRVYPQTH